ncbi:helix-turn-helix domain-containing protein [Phyllobacterium endophyticum]|uniref:Helix-turn-helix domain-containing protein n=1 Tax=Phyllobacterium endophyticum TaxID=1149773 RepID=A0A2P7AYN1_9HYPH|nr:helix-turn-helix domain-containing protein [Phyllobacterium endophyticum]MBB3236131.1 AraC-like DNA-binding protein [Phyllobacterium endophyticum]PSH59316.1 hypothetical protein CU100_00475 [Phyllobacterium endophyticum]TYR41441.1 helix-turn-helix domain-containing protein [Phyllobacterium endophyticum]
MDPSNNGKSLVKLAYSISEACQVSGLSPGSLHKLFNEGHLTRRKIGKRTFVMGEELIEFLRTRPQTKWNTGSDEQ